LSDFHRRPAGMPTNREAIADAQARDGKPDHGSVNFPDSVYANSPELIERLARDMKTHGIKPEMEIFDVSMIRNAVELAEKGWPSALHFDFVMGLKGAIPAPSKPGAPQEQIPRDPPGPRPASPGQLVMNTHAILMAAMCASAWRTTSTPQGEPRRTSALSSGW